MAEIMVTPCTEFQVASRNAASAPSVVMVAEGEPPLVQRKHLLVA